MYHKKRKLCRIAVLAIFLAVLTGFAYYVPDTNAERKKEPDKPELTIWVDSGNELSVRMALCAYVQGEAGGMNEYSSYYPPFVCKLEDKSYLTGEQLRQELAAALEQGSGPDLILMDEANGIDMQALMESGNLLELEENFTQEYLGYPDTDYLDGTLELGQMNGRQYILPVYVQCPVVFGLRDALEEAGADPEGGYDTLKEFLEGMLSAAEHSEKQIFENVCAVDWLEQYAMPQAPEENGEEQDTEALKDLLARVRKCSGTEEDYFSPYESLESGESLLSGCGFDRKPMLAQNTALLGADRIAFLAVPAWDGEVRVVVTQSAAVNANTDYPEEACAFLRFFQSGFVHNSLIHQTYPALGIQPYWENQLSVHSSQIDKTIYPEYAASAETITAKSMTRFLACARDAVTDAVYQTASRKMETGCSTDISRKDVLTIGFGDHGMGSAYPLYRWLSEAAAQYSDDQLHIQLVPLSIYKFSFIVYQDQMEQAGAGMDIILDSLHAIEAGGSSSLGSIPADLTPYLETREEELQTMDLSGCPKGLLYGIERREGKEDRQYCFWISDKSALKKEAFGFCAAALKADGYEAAVRAAGCDPVNIK